MCTTVFPLAEQVDALASVEVSALPLDALMQLVDAAVGPMNRLAGVVSRAVGEITVRGNGQVPDPAIVGAICPTPAWLRATAQVTGNAAGRQVRTAVAMRELPAVVDAVIDGLITVEHGRVLTRLVGRIDPQRLLESQPQLIEVARRTDPGQLAAFVRHLIATWCEPVLEAEEAAAEDRRFLQVRNTHRGSWRGSFELPDAAMEPLLTVLESLARRDGVSDTRSSGQRRADVLSDLFGLGLRFGDLPDSGGSRPLVSYVVPAWWTHELRTSVRRLARDPLTSAAAFRIDLDQHPGADCPTGAWTGPATRSQIERLLCDARVQRVALGDDGQLISLTSMTDQITAAQRRAVAARDRCCTAKGCSRPPAFCDVHHLRARADGGAADVGNVVLLCRRHHLMWHRKLLHLTDLRTPWLRLPPPRAPAFS